MVVRERGSDGIRVDRREGDEGRKDLKETSSLREMAIPTNGASIVSTSLKAFAQGIRCGIFLMMKGTWKGNC